MHSPSPHSCYTPSPSHPPWIDHSNLMSLHHSSIQMFSSVPCSQTPSVLCSSLSVRDQVSRPYRTTGKIIVLYILIFVFRQQTRRQKFLE
jgi:hypothetical protein